MTLVGLNIINNSVYQKQRHSWTNWLLYATAVNDKMVGFCDHGNILLNQNWGFVASSIQYSYS